MEAASPSAKWDVLVVEDDPSDLAMISEMLVAALGPVRVSSATELGAAVDVALGEPPDVVLLDLGLPDQAERGLATLHAFRERVPDAVVVVFTGINDDAIGRAAVQAGAQEFVVKGRMDAAVLGRVVRHAVTRADMLRQLEERNRALDAFASVVSHDLKAPLRGVRRMAEALRHDLETGGVVTGPIGVNRVVDEALGDEVETSLAMMEEQVTAMGCLVDGILDVARAGRSNAPTADVDLSRAVEKAVRVVGLPAGFEVVPPPQGITAHAPRADVDQVVQNLIGNAVKHHDGATGTITIEAEPVGDNVVITVADDGPGVPAGRRDAVFHMFYTATGRVAGHGLGLTLVKRIVEAHGGHVRLFPNEPRGCRFVLTLPRGPTTSPPVAVDVMPALPARPAPVPDAAEPPVLEPVVGPLGTGIREAGNAAAPRSTGGPATWFAGMTAERFAYAIGHDLKEPLRAVSSYGALLSERYGDELDERGRDYLDHVLTGAARAGAMVEGLQILGRLAATTPDAGAVAVAPIIAQAIDDLAQPIAARGVTVATDVQGQVQADGHLLKAVVVALLENAVLHGRDNGNVRVSTTSSNGVDRVIVEDDGPGVEEDLITRMFEPFRKRRRESAGVGLGLTVASLIAHRHGGRLEWQRGRASGACLVLELPNQTGA